MVGARRRLASPYEAKEEYPPAAPKTAIAAVRAEAPRQRSSARAPKPVAPEAPPLQRLQVSNEPRALVRRKLLRAVLVTGVGVARKLRVEGEVAFVDEADMLGIELAAADLE